MKKKESDVVEHAYNPSPWEVEAENHEFQASLGHSEALSQKKLEITVTVKFWVRIKTSKCRHGEVRP